MLSRFLQSTLLWINFVVLQSEVWLCADLEVPNCTAGQLQWPFSPSMMATSGLEALTQQLGEALNNCNPQRELTRPEMVCPARPGAAYKRQKPNTFT